MCFFKLEFKPGVAGSSSDSEDSARRKPARKKKRKKKRANPMAGLEGFTLPKLKKT